MDMQKLQNLKRIQARVKALNEECARLCEEIEEHSVFAEYYHDPMQAADYATWFHDQQQPWLAHTELEYMIVMMEAQAEEEKKLFLAGLGPTEDIPF